MSRDWIGPPIASICEERVRVRLSFGNHGRKESSDGMIAIYAKGPTLRPSGLRLPWRSLERLASFSLRPSQSSYPGVVNFDLVGHREQLHASLAGGKRIVRCIGKVMQAS